MKAKMMMNKTEKVFESLLSMTHFQSQVSSSKTGTCMYSVCECGSSHRGHRTVFGSLFPLPPLSETGFLLCLPIYSILQAS